MGAFEPPGVDEHAAFMTGLADEGFVLFAGPVAGSEHDRIRVLLIAEATTTADVYDRLAADPWACSQQLATATVEPWTLFVGAERLARNQTAR